MSGGTVRPYDRERDLPAVERIWREIGWTTSAEQVAHVGTFYDAGRALVQELNGTAESTSHIARGSIRHLDHDLVLSAVTAVNTSYVARKQGAARRLLARMLAEEAAHGAHVAALGIFDQGFYDQLGFGTASYDHRFAFDPTILDLDRRPRPPVRLTADDWADVHASMMSRLRSHGGVCIDEPLLVKAELAWQENPFGLGYRDAAGELTHFVYGEAKGEHGPYHVNWMAYRDVEQLLELLALLKSLGDQVHEVVLLEPPHVQFQDLLRQPFREARRIAGKAHHRSFAWWQLRILDLERCIDAAHFAGEEVRFNLDLRDPVVGHLPDDVGWPGVAGRFVVTLGAASDVEEGTADGLPTLRTRVGPFSRLLFGVREASALAATSHLHGEPELLARLDRTVRTPDLRAGWDF